MRFAFCPNPPACPPIWLLAVALSVAAVTTSASAAAADKPDTPRAAVSIGLSKPVNSTASTKTTKTAKPTPTTRPARAAAPRQVLKSAASDLALASATAEAINDAQLEIAARVLTGDVECEFNQRITVLPEPDQPGYFRVAHKNLRYRMLPRETATGAVRLEDAAAGIVWLQIPTKSMLMNARIGQRLVDACTHAEQRVALATVADAANGLGILPAVAAAPGPASMGAATDGAADPNVDLIATGTVTSPAADAPANAASAAAETANVAANPTAEAAAVAPATPLPPRPPLPPPPQVQQAPEVPKAALTEPAGEAKNPAQVKPAAAEAPRYPG